MRKLCCLLIVLPLMACSQTDETISNGTAKIHYRTFGSGKPMLIINGGPGMNSEGFASLAEKLSKDSKTIIYDQRGTGKSTLEKIDATTISMDLMLQDIETLRKHLDIDKWTVLGHSFGGMLASYYATKYPESIDKLILSSSGGIDLALRNNVQARLSEKLTKTERDSLAYWNQKMEAGDNSYKTRIGRGRNLAPAYVYDKKYVSVIAERLTQGNPAINELLWADMDKMKFNCAPKLQSFTQPVLILQGKNDILTPSIAETSHKAFKNSQLIMLDKCGHYGWLDAPETYFSSINYFLKNN